MTSDFIILYPRVCICYFGLVCACVCVHRYFCSCYSNDSDVYHCPGGHHGAGHLPLSCRLSRRPKRETGWMEGARNSLGWFNLHHYCQSYGGDLHICFTNLSSEFCSRARSRQFGSWVVFPTDLKGTCQLIFKSKRGILGTVFQFYIKNAF